MVNAGDTAPDFSLPRVNGTELSLSSLRGKKVLLSFYRYASCPLCNFRIAQLKKRNYDTLEILAVFQSPADVMRKYVSKPDDFGPGMTLLCDPEETIYNEYQVGSSFLGFLGGLIRGGLFCIWCRSTSPGTREGDINRLPADFLIDEQGAVVDCFLATTMDQHIPFDRIEAFISTKK